MRHFNGAKEPILQDFCFSTMQLTHRLFLPIIILFSLLSFSCDPAQAGSDDKELAKATTTFILVRHAEKQEGDDPQLTPEGQARAERLSQQLKNEEIAAVYSTAFNRTMSTAQPTAKSHQLGITTYSPSNPTELARQLISKHRGQKVLIVGHSNSTPTLANALSGTKKLSRFDESDYGNIVTVSINGKGKKLVDVKRY